MSYAAKVIKDSISLAGVRLVTMEATYPRFVHAELLTHRLFSRNAASSRAIPIKKMIKRVQDEPVEPVFWGKNQKGMQAQERLSFEETIEARKVWLLAADQATATADHLAYLDVHKQLVNRIIEPWSWITVIISATEWGNFFSQRCHPDAQPEIRHIAEMMQSAMAKHVAHPLGPSAWHVPYLDIDDQVNIADRPETDIFQKVSTARCARVSYLTHDGKIDVDKDLELYDRLATANPPHASPFEHVATPLEDPDVWCGNFRGFCQWRHQAIHGQHMKAVM
jgi:thymidylate synthase ThyX